MRDDIPYRVTLDRRDLFDFVRGAIKGILDDYADKAGNVECWAHQEAHERTIELFAKLKLPGPDTALIETPAPEAIRARCKALGMPDAVADALIAANCR